MREDEVYIGFWFFVSELTLRILEIRDDREQARCIVKSRKKL